MKAKKGIHKEDKRDEISEAVLRKVEEEFYELVKEAEAELMRDEPDIDSPAQANGIHD